MLLRAGEGRRFERSLIQLGSGFATPDKNIITALCPQEISSQASRSLLEWVCVWDMYVYIPTLSLILVIYGAVAYVHTLHIFLLNLSVYHYNCVFLYHFFYLCLC